MAPTNARLKVVEAQISETVSHIEDLKAQVERAEIKLQHLREQEAAILKTSKDHRRVLSAIRHIPEDVLREILIACVQDNIPSLSGRQIPLLYVLAQISSVMRHIALATSIIWARMYVPHYSKIDGIGNKAYSILARRATKWFERARGLPLTLFLSDSTLQHNKPDPSLILFDALLRYATHWQDFRFESSSKTVSTAMIFISALTAADLPLLQSVTLDIGFSLPRSLFSNAAFLTVPTLKHVSLFTNDLRSFAVNWAVLTSISLNSKWDSSYYSTNEIANILRQAKHLVFCKIYVGRGRASGEQYLQEIILPYLKTLHVNDGTCGRASSGVSSLLDLVTAPALEILCISPEFFKSSLSNFLQRSPNIWKLSIPYLPEDVSLIDTSKFLRHCPSLTVLFLWQSNRDQNTRSSKSDANMFLRAFVEESEGNAGVICPHLQYINFTGDIDFSLQTLQLFLERKHGKTAISNISTWKRVILDLRSIKVTEKHKQIMYLVSQKKAEGLDVDAFSKQTKLPRDRHFYE